MHQIRKYVESDLIYSVPINMDVKLNESFLKKIIEEANEKQTKQIQETIYNIKSDISEIKEKLSQEIGLREKIEEKYHDLEMKYKNLEKQTKKNNIIIFGLHHKKTKNKNQDKHKLLDFSLAKLNQYLDTQIQPCDVDDIYSLGQQEYNNPVLIKFCSFIKKQQILQNCKKLKGSGIVISEDLKPEEREVNKFLYKHLKEARQENKIAYIRANKLYIDNKPYSVDDLKQINERDDNRIETREEVTTDKNIIGEEEETASGTTTRKQESARIARKILEIGHNNEVEKTRKPTEMRVRSNTRKKL